MVRAFWNMIAVSYSDATSCLPPLNVPSPSQPSVHVIILSAFNLLVTPPPCVPRVPHFLPHIPLQTFQLATRPCFPPDFKIRSDDLPSQPGGCKPLGCKRPFRRGHLRPSAYQTFTLWFITVSELQLWSSHGNNFMVGSRHHTRNCVKGSQP